jgi:hypothetical protein
MTPHPLNEAQKRYKSGEHHRLENLSRPLIELGNDTSIRARPTGGVTIARKGVSVRFCAAQIPDLINALHHLTDKDSAQ